MQKQQIETPLNMVSRGAQSFNIRFFDSSDLLPYLNGVPNGDGSGAKMANYPKSRWQPVNVYRDARRNIAQHQGNGILGYIAEGKRLRRKKHGY
jgi:hypothetical protein